MPLSADREAQMKQEHFDKYEEISKRIGIDALRSLLYECKVNTGQGSITLVDKIKASTDPYLNDAGSLTLWDRMAGVTGKKGPGHPDWPEVGFHTPWLPSVARGLSLAERVCALKHVARYYLLEEEVSQR